MRLARREKHGQSGLVAALGKGVMEMAWVGHAGTSRAQSGYRLDSEAGARLATRAYARPFLEGEVGACLATRACAHPFFV